MSSAIVVGLVAFVVMLWASWEAGRHRAYNVVLANAQAAIRRGDIVAGSAHITDMEAITDASPLRYVFGKASAASDPSGSPK